MNRRFVLASRPENEPSDENFRLETGLPIPEPGPGQVLVKHSYLSIDPYMRGRMSDRASYAKPVGIGELMVGGTVGTVVESRSERFRKGDVLVGYGGWQEYALFSDADRQVLAVAGSLPISTALGVCGMPGATAYFGLRKLGQPKEGETVVVSAAAGAVGSVVGQLAKRAGCRAVGVAGGPDKCAFVVKELGFDACVDRRDPAFRAKLAEACPRGVDVYFENVGGEVLVAVSKLLNPGARVPICGFVSQYNEADPESPFAVLGALPTPPFHRFFLVWEWPDEYPGVVAELRALVEQGSLRYREDVVKGLEAAPGALRAVLRGENFGKMVVAL
ncbi:MAG TPA: NADP-dependent oxidoreductase [Polyangiaceae bacterium]|nr:NADP-dependent oxidoreductase [Polyangiaceae bacterium]